MKKILILGLIMIFMLSSCYKKSQSSEIKGREFEVEFLFEKEGVKVYRFWDGGYPRYFTSKGETMSQISHGKSATTENIQ